VHKGKLMRMTNSSEWKNAKWQQYVELVVTLKVNRTFTKVWQTWLACSLPRKKMGLHNDQRVW
jgi:hypothetical protein